MTNYIPADKLIAEIERLSATEYGGNTLGDDVANGALDYVLEEIIPSLQQEQPEVDLEKEIDRELDTRWKGEYLSTSNHDSMENTWFARVYNDYKTLSDVDNYSTYEEACEAAITYCLKNLI